MAAEGAERRAKREQPWAFLSRDDVERRLEAALRAVARKSFEFAALLRRLIPVFLIPPVQALDSGQIRPRAKLTLQLPLPGEESALPEPLPFDLIVDLFDAPQHIEQASKVRQYRADHPETSLKTAGKAWGLGSMTVKRARDYAGLMERAGLNTPYRELLEQPAHASRWKPRNANSANTRTAVRDTALTKPDSTERVQPVEVLRTA